MPAGSATGRRRSIQSEHRQPPHRRKIL